MKTNPNETINPISVFGVHRIRGQDNDVAMMKGGLTKREYFAALALQNLTHTVTSELDMQHIDHCSEWMAKSAVTLADALIKALNEEKAE